MVAGATAVAVAVTVVVEPMARTAAAAGAVRLTEGWLPPVTVRATAAEVVVAPRLSVATAVRE